MAPRAKKVIRLKVTSIAPDPNQYKPWSPTLEPDRLFIDVAVPSDEVTMSKATGTQGGDETNLTLKGFKLMLKEVGLALYELNEEFTTEVRKSKVVTKKK